MSRQPTIDPDPLLADLAELAQMGATPEGGVHRIAYGPDDMRARRWVMRRMDDLRMAPVLDAAGNVVGRWGGPPGRPAIALGSHTDSVPNGGRYDGALGVLAGLACVAALARAGVTPRHPIEVIDFAAEEATMGGGTLGSRAMAGLVEPRTGEQTAWDGADVASHLRAAGLDPVSLGTARRPPGTLAAYLELHVEQGGLLEAAGIPIGLVEGIVGIRRLAASFAGEANHAGTTPMAVRRDALVAAAPFVGAVREVAVRLGIVGTVGVLRVRPGASNVIPGRVDLEAEIRALDAAALDAAEAELAAIAAAAGGSLRRVSDKEPVAVDARVLAALAAGCADADLAGRRMPSGAGHDAMNMAALAPMGMLFVPSHGGKSHCPDELTSPDLCVAGARALLAGLLRLDADLPVG